MNDVVDVKPNEGGAGGADPKEVKPDAAAATFDPSKISDEEFSKVFDDPRTFQHSRFKELTDAQRQLKELKANQQKADEERMKKQGDFEKLAEQRQKEAEGLRSELTNTRIDNRLLAEAQKLNVIDPDAVLKMVDRSTIKAEDNGVTGTKEAIEALLKDKPYLAGKPGTQRLGSPSNPGNQNTGELKRFKLSEIQNAEFYRENEKDILASYKAGLVENDMG